MLPPPINGTEQYLKAVHDRLGEILDRLSPSAEPAVASDGAVELREPDTPAPPLPEEPEEAPVSGSGTRKSSSRTRKAPTKRTPG